jgi:hypothetical protein
MLRGAARCRAQCPCSAVECVHGGTFHGSPGVTEATVEAVTECRACNPQSTAMIPGLMGIRRLASAFSARPDLDVRIKNICLRFIFAAKNKPQTYFFNPDISLFNPWAKVRVLENHPLTSGLEPFFLRSHSRRSSKESTKGQRKKARRACEFREFRKAQRRRDNRRVCRERLWTSGAAHKIAGERDLRLAVAIAWRSCIAYQQR